jgi:hypothetical protein
MVSGTAHLGAPGTSDSADTANPAPHESAAPDPDASSTNAHGNGRPAPPGNPGTTPQARPRDRSSSALGLGRKRVALGYIDVIATLGSTDRRLQSCGRATSRP